MTKKEISEVKISLYEKEIEESKNQIINFKEARSKHQGALIVFNDVTELVTSMFREVKKSLEWNKTSEDDKKEKLAIDAGNKPRWELEDKEGLKFAEIMKPFLQILTKKVDNTEKEINQFEAQIFIAQKNIERFEKNMKYEQLIVSTQEENEKNGVEEYAGMEADEIKAENDKIAEQQIIEQESKNEEVLNEETEEKQISETEKIVEDEEIKLEEPKKKKGK